MTRANIETFIISQHSIGVGHLTRSSAIAEALSAISHVTMFSGGIAVEGYSAPSGVDFVQLPATRSGTTVDAPTVSVDPRYALAEIEQMRSKLLVDKYLRIKPKILIVEYFPFAPKRFGKTLNKLFEAIQQEKERPIVISSIRACPLRPWDASSEAAWINKQLREKFSCVFHHADPKLFPLTSLGGRTQSALSGISVWQTGFVRRPLASQQNDYPTKGLLLTVGGGAHGANLLERWISAARKGSPELFPINLVCGPFMNANDRKILRAAQDANLTVHDWVANLDDLMRPSRAVVCMGGYNTLVEALSLQKPVLAFPDHTLGDQPFQVSALHAQGMLLKGDASQSVCEITTLMNELLNFRPQHPIDCNGAERSVEIVEQLLA